MTKLIEMTRARQRAAREHAYATPLSKFHPGNPELFRTDTLWPYFERLRQEAPVHFCSTSPVGNYWSVTKYSDIMRVETNAAIYSSDLRHGGIMLRDVDPEYQWPNFIAMDAPKHGPQRKTVLPMFSPAHLNKLAVLIRERSAEILDNLPRNEPFNWVDRVSVELTTQMLATLFAFPWEDRRKLTRWSDLATALPKSKIYESEEQRSSELAECRDYFTRLWNERANAELQSDLISMMAHSEATRHMDRDNLFGNIILLIVGGNDTTRNALTGSVLALNENPNEYEKLRSNHALIDSFVPEGIVSVPPLLIPGRARETTSADSACRTVIEHLVFMSRGCLGRPTLPCSIAPELCRSSHCGQRLARGVRDHVRARRLRGLNARGPTSARPERLSRPSSRTSPASSR